MPGASEGTVEHAQLTLGTGMIMLGSARDDEYGKMVRPPEAPDAILTQSAYLVVGDIDAHYARAKSKGAQIVMALGSAGLRRKTLFLPGS